MSDFIKYVDIERIGTPENAIMFDFPEDVVVVEEKVDGDFEIVKIFRRVV